MATAIKVTITTPTSVRGVRVKATGPGFKIASLGYDHELSLIGNAQAALEVFLVENRIPMDYELAPLGNGDFVAVQIPERFIKARDAVIGVRRAISRGDLSGNPHTKQWVQAITDLTDGNQGPAFTNEYAAAVMSEIN